MNQFLRQFLTTQGRMSRSHFWLYVAFLFVISFLVGTADEFLQFSETVKTVVGIVFLPIFLVGIIVQIKRFHDFDQPGWFVLLNLIPCIGGLIVLVLCGFVEGTPGPNRYGPDPSRPEIMDADEEVLDAEIID